MSIGVAIILAVGFALSGVAIGLGLLISGYAKKDAMQSCMTRAMFWLKHESGGQAKDIIKAAMKAYKDLE